MRIGLPEYPFKSYAQIFCLSRVAFLPAKSRGKFHTAAVRRGIRLFSSAWNDCIHYSIVYAACQCKIFFGGRKSEWIRGAPIVARRCLQKKRNGHTAGMPQKDVSDFDIGLTGAQRRFAMAGLQSLGLQCYRFLCKIFAEKIVEVESLHDESDFGDIRNSIVAQIRLREADFAECTFLSRY